MALLRILNYSKHVVSLIGGLLKCGKTMFAKQLANILCEICLSVPKNGKVFQYEDTAHFKEVPPMDYA